MKKMLATLALCVAATTSSATTVTFTETKFRDSDVSFGLISGDPRRQALASASDGNNGAFRVQTLRARPGQSRFGAATSAVLINGATIELSTFTPVSFDFSFQFNRIASFAAVDLFGLVVKQGDNFFGTEPTSPFGGIGNRTVFRGGVTADSFQLLSSEPALLDLTPLGEDIQLGFLHGTRSGTSTSTGFVDDFSVTVSGADISPIPIPASIPLLTTAIGALAFVSRRRRRGQLM